ncbi:MAG: 3'(2'),5'-bisphosphate nucleotidase CysQ [Neptuniibacter sp.]
MSKAQTLFNNNQLLEALKALMKAADRAILEVYKSHNFEMKTKEDSSPVTKADLAAHHVLLDGLSQLTPDIPVVSEEDPNSLNIPKTSPIFWLIDPLDGTKEFIKRNGEFTCNVALIENQATTLGFVSIPDKDELYYGGKEMGAFLEIKQSQPEQIRYSTAPGITRVVASKSHLNKETQDFIANQSGTVELIQAGSSLKFLKIATGLADLYPRLAPTCEWDTAAAHAVLEGAGGQVTQADGSPLTYGKDNILNPFFIASAN